MRTVSRTCCIGVICVSLALISVRTIDGQPPVRGVLGDLMDLKSAVTSVKADVTALKASTSSSDLAALRVAFAGVTFDKGPASSGNDVVMGRSAKAYKGHLDLDGGSLAGSIEIQPSDLSIGTIGNVRACWVAPGDDQDIKRRFRFAARINGDKIQVLAFVTGTGDLNFNGTLFVLYDKTP
jgi:hypothetical protein